MQKYLVVLLPLMAMACTAPRPSLPPPAIAPARPATRPREPDPFLGLGADKLQALAGRPAFARRDGATEMWRYDTPTCRAFFFLTGNPASVQRVDTLPEGPGDSPDPACLNALRAALPAG